MSRPADSISRIRLPDGTEHKIVPYAIGKSSSNQYQATLPDMFSDGVLVVENIINLNSTSGTVNLTQWSQLMQSNHAVIRYEHSTPGQIASTEWEILFYDHWNLRKTYFRNKNYTCVVDTAISAQTGTAAYTITENNYVDDVTVDGVSVVTDHTAVFTNLAKTNVDNNFTVNQTAPSFKTTDTNQGTHSHTYVTTYGSDYMYVDYTGESNGKYIYWPDITANDTLAVGSIIADEYNENSIEGTYWKGAYCRYKGFLYKANGSTYGAWDSSKWDKVSIGSQLNLLEYGNYVQSVVNSAGYMLGGVQTPRPLLSIHEASNHADYMFDFLSHELGPSSHPVLTYSTKIYPGRITLNGNDVATVLQVPSSFEWTNGTSWGPTGTLKNSAGTELVSYSAIPSASIYVSGVVTTIDQAFAGNKTIHGNVIISGNDRGFKIQNIQSTVDEQTEYLRSKITRTRDGPDTSGDYSYEYLYPNRSGTLGLQVDIVDLTELAA